ncbi:MAG: gliding motility-associated C-terminal domain-containing protein, partial [Flavobacteriales bacterium]
IATQEVVVEVSPNGAFAQLPPVNIVTPNGDGINDCLFFDTGGAPASNFQDFSLRVFNRWGTLVYEGSGISSRWCPNDLHEGSYVYVVSYTDRCTGEAKELRELVTIKR